MRSGFLGAGVGPLAFAPTDYPYVVNPAATMRFEDSPDSEQGAVGTVAGGVIYRPGKFGKAVQVAEATTNLVANPSFEIDTNGYSCVNITGERVTADAVYGSACLHLYDATGGGNKYLTCNFSLPAGTTYTFSFAIKSKLNGGNAFVLIGGPGFSTIPLQFASPVWERKGITFTTDAAGTYYFLLSYDACTGGDFWIDAVQLEQKSYATPYCDGSLGTGHTWSGTPHASSSTRAIGYVYWSVDLGASHTILAWINVDALHALNNYFLGDGVSFSLGIAPSATVSCYHNGWVTFGAGSVTPGTWQQVAMVFDAASNVATLYLDGNLLIATAVAPLSPSGTLITGIANESYQFNGLIDDLIILPYAASAQLIADLYAANRPVRVR